MLHLLLLYVEERSPCIYWLKLPSSLSFRVYGTSIRVRVYKTASSITYIVRRGDLVKKNEEKADLFCFVFLSRESGAGDGGRFIS